MSLFEIDYTFQWAQVMRYWPQLLAGSWTTIEIAAISIALGILIALALTAMRQSHWRTLRVISGAWISIARNTPALLQIYILYFGLGGLGFTISSGVALTAGITFNNAGYLAENFRGGLRAIPHTQVRAARSLGMTAFQAFTLVVVPQLLRIVFAPMTNQMVWAVLMTSLGVVVGLGDDLMGVTQNLNAVTFRTFEFFMIAAVLYYLIAKITMAGARLAGWRLFRY